MQLRKLRDKAWLNNNQATESSLCAQIKSLDEQWNKVRAERDHYCAEKDRRELSVRGEIDAFVEYSFRSGTGGSRTSWQTLAEMQHHGVPTRLLDWTEVLSVALYFSLGRYRKELEAGWTSASRINGSSVSDRYRRNFFIPDILKVPSIWILNPFLLSDGSTRRKRIWDLTMDPAFDYYNCFFVRQEWHFRKPIPMVSPWVSQRIAAQQGLFTVFGYRQEPLEEQSPKVIREVKIDPPAAVYAVRHLIEFCGITHYSLFRDLDSLGSRMREEYLPGSG